MSVGQKHSNAAGGSSTLTDFVAMQSLKGNLAKSWTLADYNVIHNCEWFKEEDVCQLWDNESQTHCSFRIETIGKMVCPCLTILWND